MISGARRSRFHIGGNRFGKGETDSAHRRGAQADPAHRCRAISSRGEPDTLGQIGRSAAGRAHPIRATHNPAHRAQTRGSPEHDVLGNRRPEQRLPTTRRRLFCGQKKTTIGPAPPFSDRRYLIDNTAQGQTGAPGADSAFQTITVNNGLGEHTYDSNTVTGVRFASSAFGNLAN